MFFWKQILHKSGINGSLRRSSSRWREATTGDSPKSVGDGGSLSAMRVKGVNKVQRQRCLKKGFAKDWLGWAGRKGRRAGKRPQGMAKRLTLTERRLSFTFAEGTPRPEGQVLRQPRGGPMEAALNFSLPFLSREKEGNVHAAAIDPKPPHKSPLAWHGC